MTGRPAYFRNLPTFLLEHEAEVYRETGSLDDAFKGLPLQDAEAALDYYFENLNEGRPFILAGHSQGAAILKELLKTYFRDHPEYYQLVLPPDDAG